MGFYWVWRAPNNQIRCFISWFCRIIVLLSLFKAKWWIYWFLHLPTSYPTHHFLSKEFSGALQNPLLKLICHRKISPNIKISLKNYPCPLLGLEYIECLLNKTARIPFWQTPVNLDSHALSSLRTAKITLRNSDCFWALYHRRVAHLEKSLSSCLLPEVTSPSACWLSCLWDFSKWIL